MFRGDPVGLPGLATLACGGTLFLIALLAARRRRALAGVETIAGRRPISWLWIAVQGAGIALVASGPVHATLDPAAPRAIGAALTVAVLMGTAVWLFDAASRAMGANWSLEARLRDDHALIQSGPFAYVRHPIYVAIFLVLVAIAVAAGHLARLAIGVPVYAAGTAWRVAAEERLLRGTFRERYDDYARRVRRFIPGVF